MLRQTGGLRGPPFYLYLITPAADSLMYAVKREGKDNVKMEVVGR